VEALVFARYIDFKEHVTSNTPDIIITYPRLIQQLPDYSIRLHGMRDGTTDESYVIVTTDSLFTLSSISSKNVVGTIDLFGRSGTSALFSLLFAPPPPTPQRVSKIEDLPLLITYNMAQAVMLFKKDVSYLKQRTAMNLYVIPMPNAKEGIVCVAERSSKNSSKILEYLKQNNPGMNQLLGVDLWK
jgi:hypothetical protein